MPIDTSAIRTRPAGEDGESDVFLKIVTKRTRIKGEAAVPGHEDDIQLVGWSWGIAANTAIGSGQATARRSYKHLVATKAIDSASTGLMAALATNDEVREAKLTMRKGGGDALDYFTMTLANARIVGLDVEVGADGRPHERIAIAFTKVDVQYQRQQGSGVSGGAYTFSDEVLPT